MKNAAISPRFQITIPKEVRRKMNLKPGQKMFFLYVKGGLELIPIQEAKKARGIAAGLKLKIKREKDRSF